MAATGLQPPSCRCLAAASCTWLLPLPEMHPLHLTFDVCVLMIPGLMQAVSRTRNRRHFRTGGGKAPAAATPAAWMAGWRPVQTHHLHGMLRVRRGFQREVTDCTGLQLVAWHGNSGRLAAPAAARWAGQSQNGAKAARIPLLHRNFLSLIVRPHFCLLARSPARSRAGLSLSRSHGVSGQVRSLLHGLRGVVQRARACSSASACP